MKTTIVISLHNEEKHIEPLLKELAKQKKPIVVVNDGSTDKSVKKIKELRIKNLTLLEHGINLGKGAAMKTGAQYAWSHRADAVIFMDADGQHKPEDLQKFVSALESNKYDIVFGSRNLSYGVPLIRYLGNKLASVMMVTLFGIYVSDVICGFRALTKKAYKKVQWESGGYGVETEIVARVGKNKLRYTEVLVETIYHDRVKGVTILDAVGVFMDVVRWRLTI